MTTVELVQILAQHPPGLRVVVNGYEEGYDNLSPEQLSVVSIGLNVGKHPWEGQHGDPDGLPDKAEVVQALLLRRTSN